MAGELEEWDNFKAKVARAASCHVSAIVAKCQERRVLDEQELEAITRSKEDVNNADGAQVLLEAVENAIKRRPNAYDAFIAILEETLTGDSATLASEMKKELQIRRDREHVAECSDDAPVKSKPVTLAATKVGSKEGASSAGNGHLLANGGASKFSEGSAQVSGSGGDMYAYLENLPPRGQQLDLDDARRVLIQSPIAMHNMDAFQELQRKCDQLESDCNEKSLIEKELSKKCEVLEGLVEEKDRKLEKFQRQLDAMKTRLSGVESLKHNVSSEYAALQKRMATIQAEYEHHIEVETNEKNELTKKLRRKELRIEQSNDDIKRLTAEIKQLRQQNKCLVKENCELKIAQQRVTELGILVVLASFALMVVAILAVGAYTFSVGSYSDKRKEL